MEIEDDEACSYDYVEVYDDGSLLGRYCGFETPPALKSTTNVLTVMFHSDDTTNMFGFGAVFFQRGVNGTTADENRCGPTQTGLVGKFVSVDLDFDGYYDNNVNCTWKIAPSVPPDKIVEVKITKIDIPSDEDCSLDYLEIHDENISYGVFCGTSLPPSSIRPASDVFYVSFYSDDSINGEGFEALYAVIGVDGKCGGIITTSYGEIESVDSDGDGEYDDESHCIWVLVAPDDKSIELIFTSFDIEGDNICSYDYVEFYDGQFGFEASKGRFCGSEIPPTITSKSNILYLEFYADESIGGSGFYFIFNHIDAVPVESTTTLSFTTTQPITAEETTTTTSRISTAFLIETTELPTDLNLCGPVETYISGFFGSTDNDLDGYYDNGINCTWNFRLNTFYEKTVPSSVQVQITKMDIPSDEACRLDHLEIYDGSRSYGVFCGSSVPDIITVTSFNFAARFYSDDSINGEGFEAVFAVKELGRCYLPAYYAPSIQASQNKEWALGWGNDVSKCLCSKYEDELCGGILNAKTGVIESVDRDGDGEYDDSVYCVWVIIAPENQHIEMEFTFLDLEEQTFCWYDAVKLYDGQFLSSASVGKFCGYQVPRRIVTESNVLFFEFYSDDILTGTGFYADYSFTDGPADYTVTPLLTTSEIPTGPVLCGPTFTSLAGYFDSTGTNSSLENGVNCLWMFDLAALLDTVVNIQIVINIDIPSDDCQLDYLEIYDENSSYGVFCGSSVQEEVVISTSGVFYAKIYSENTGIGNGFAAVYTAFDEDGKCGGVLTGPTGFIGSVDKDGDGFYDFDKHCVWAILAPNEQRIELAFSYIDVEEDDECFYDFVEVYDGQFNMTESKVGRFCGTELPPVIHSASIAIFLEFYSDSSVVGTGFGASFSFLQAFCRSCGCYLTAPSGWFTSPDADGDGFYENNLDCYWKIIADEGKLIELQFLEMEIESHRSCIYDFVQVLDGGEILLGPYCGTFLPSTITSQKNTLLVYFHSDFGYAERGFKASYSHIEWSGPVLCGPTFTSLAGYFDSTGTNSSLENGVNCLWMFDLAALLDTVVNIQIVINIDIPSDDCQLDYLEIYDENSSYGVFCGSSVQEEVVISTSGVFYAKIYSENTGIGNGFAAVYTVFDEDGKCGGVLTGPTGFIGSVDKDGDGFYDFDKHCVWAILAPNEQRIELAFSYIDVEEDDECFYDFVEVYDGQFNMTESKVGRFCGTETPPVIHSASIAIFLEFYSDSSVVGTGFGASFSFLQAFCRSCGCNLTAPSGWFTSPDADGDGFYENNLDCYWKIIADEGKLIELQFLEMEIESHRSCIYDFVQVLDGGEILLGQYCGTFLPSTITSQKNTLLVYFHSDFGYAERGFKASYSHIEWSGPKFCEYIHPIAIGTFNSSALDSDTDGNYDHNVDCTWVLTATAEKRLQVYITDMDIPSGESCEFDHIEIFDYNISVGVFCGTAEPPLITSTHNILYIHFYSDATINGNGFQAYFSIVDKDLMCGEMLTSGSGVIWSTDRDGDGIYDTFLDCTWTIIAPVGQIIKLEFHYVNLEGWGTSCVYDVIKIFDGEYTDATPIEEICGFGNTPTLWSLSRIFYLYFHTDNTGDFVGFNVSYSVHEKGPTSTTKRASTNSYTTMTSEASSTKSDEISTETSTVLSSEARKYTSSTRPNTKGSSKTGGPTTIKAITVSDKASTKTSTLLSTEDVGYTSSVGSSTGSSAETSRPTTVKTTSVTDKTSTETFTVLSTEDVGYTSPIGSSTENSAKTSRPTTVNTTIVTEKTSTETSTVLSTEDVGYTSPIVSRTKSSAKTSRPTAVKTTTETDKTVLFTKDIGSSTESSAKTSRPQTVKTTFVTDKTSTETFTVLSTENFGYSSPRGSTTESSAKTSRPTAVKNTTVTDKTAKETSTVLSTEDVGYTSPKVSSTESSAKTSRPTAVKTTTETDKTSTETLTVLSTEDVGYTSPIGSSTESSAKTSRLTTVKTTTVTDTISTATPRVLSTEDVGYTSPLGSSTKSSAKTGRSTTIKINTETDKTSTETSTVLSTEDVGFTSPLGSSTEVERRSFATSSDKTKVTTEATASVKSSSHISTRGVISSTDSIATESSSTPPDTSGTSEETKQIYSTSINSTITTDGWTHKTSTLSERLTDYQTFTTETSETTDRSYAESYRVTVSRMILIYIIICLSHITIN